jgi:hypothetical protein
MIYNLYTIYRASPCTARKTTYHFDPSKIISSQIRYYQLKSKFNERLHAFKETTPSKKEEDTSLVQAKLHFMTMFRNLGILIAASVSLLGIFTTDVKAVTWRSSKAKAHQLHSVSATERKNRRNFNQTTDCDDYRFQTNKTTRKDYNPIS